MNETGLIASRHTEPVPINAALATFAEQPGPGSDTVAALAHDARNLITALGLYCDLLDEPGVLAPPFTHYRNELRLVAAAGRRLVSKLVAQSERNTAAASAALTAIPAASPAAASGEASGPSSPAAARLIRQRSLLARFDDEFAGTPITNLAEELLATRNLFAALVGAGVAVTVDVEGGARGIQLTSEDLTRILVNLVRNAAEAMPSGGRIHISLTEIGPEGQPSLAGAPTRLLLAIEDNGPGIAPELLDKVFDPGITTRARAQSGENWPMLHRGLGLAIARSVVESACGRIQVTNRPGGGARFLIELPAI
jgi:signal transduction histidine kinase